jgi:uncharacterized protein
MRGVLDSAPAEFLAHTAGFRAADPVGTNTLTTTALARSEGRTPIEPDALWIRVESETGEILGIAALAPPRAILLSPMASSTATVIAEIVADRRLSGVEGPATAATAFAEHYCAGADAGFVIDIDMRMLALRHVISPTEPAGESRAARPADLDTLISWIAEFSAEALPGHAPPPAAYVASRLAIPDTYWIWDVGGRSTSLCWQSVNAAGVVRISAVYTPADERGHGYARANVAAVSQRALDRGARACMLYTDRANPTSNRVYEAIGYEWVADVMAYSFTPGADSSGSAPAS